MLINFFIRTPGSASSLQRWRCPLYRHVQKYRVLSIKDLYSRKGRFLRQLSGIRASPAAAFQSPATQNLVQAGAPIVQNDADDTFSARPYVLQFDS